MKKASMCGTEDVKSSDNDTQLMLKTRFSMRNLFNSILQQLKMKNLNDINKLLHLSINPNTFYFRAPKIFDTIIDVQINDEKTSEIQMPNKLNDGIQTNMLEKHLKFSADDAIKNAIEEIKDECQLFIGFDADFKINDISNNPTTCVVSYQNANVIISLQTLKLNKNITIDSVSGVFKRNKNNETSMLFDASCTLFNTDLVVQLMISHSFIFSGLHCDTIEFGPVIKEIWTECPEAISNTLTTSIISDCELLYYKNRIEDNPTMMFSANIDAENLLNTLLMNINGGLCDVYNKTPLSIKVKRFYFHPNSSCSAEWPIHLDLNLSKVRRKSSHTIKNTLNENEIKAKLSVFDELSIENKSTQSYGFECSFKMEPLVTDWCEIKLLYFESESCLKFGISQLSIFNGKMNITKCTAA
eukprot:306179_1